MRWIMSVEITGDDVNIIFGAMYDSNQADYCRITVIATGIEETPASRFGTSFARKPDHSFRRPDRYEDHSERDGREHDKTV